MPVVDGVTVTGCSTVSPTASATYPDHRAIEVPMATLDSVYDGEVGFIKIDVEGHEQAVLDGAVADHPPLPAAMLVEIDERLSPGGLGARQGLFQGPRLSRLLRPGTATSSRSSLFSTERLQNPADLPDLTAPLQQRQRFGRYIYNFIFLPRDEPIETLRRMSKRLSEL